MQKDTGTNIRGQAFIFLYNETRAETRTDGYLVIRLIKKPNRTKKLKVFCSSTHKICQLIGKEKRQLMFFKVGQLQPLGAGEREPLV